MLVLRLIFCFSEDSIRENHVDREEILNKKCETWQETLYKLYLRINRPYKITMYYAWRFTEIHIHKLIFFLMVLLSVLKVR